MMDYWLVRAARLHLEENGDWALEVMEQERVRAASLVPMMCSAVQARFEAAPGIILIAGVFMRHGKPLGRVHSPRVLRDGRRWPEAEAQAHRAEW